MLREEKEFLREDKVEFPTCTSYEFPEIVE